MTPTTSEDIDFNDYMNNRQSNNPTSTNLKYFDSFSYYGSKTSLANQQKFNSNTSLDRHLDAHSIISIDHHMSQSSINMIDDQPAGSNNNCSNTENFYYPYIVQYTDITGQLYDSQTYATAHTEHVNNHDMRLDNEQTPNYNMFNNSCLLPNNEITKHSNNHHKTVLSMIIDEQSEN